MFLDHRCSTVGRTPLDEWSARRRDLYLTTHDTHNRQISMSPVGFEPKISAGLLRSWVQIPPGAWIFVCCECRLLSGTGLCDELITVLRRCVWSRNIKNGCSIYIYIYIYIYDIRSLKVNNNGPYGLYRTLVPTSGRGKHKIVLVIVWLVIRGCYGNFLYSSDISCSTKKCHKLN